MTVDRAQPALRGLSHTDTSRGFAMRVQRLVRLRSFREPARVPTPTPHRTITKTHTQGTGGEMLAQAIISRPPASRPKIPPKAEDLNLALGLAGSVAILLLSL